MEKFKCDCSGINNHREIYMTIIKQNDIFHLLGNKEVNKCIVKNILRFCSINDDGNLFAKIINKFNIHSLKSFDKKKLIELLIREGTINCLNQYDCSSMKIDISYLSNTCLQTFYCVEKKKKIIDYLCYNGANLDYRDHDGNNIFFNSIIHGNVHLTKYLLEKDCDPHSHNYKTGETSLMRAIKSNNFEIFILLLSLNVDVEKSDFYGNNISNHIMFQMLVENYFDDDKLKIVNYMHDHKMLIRKKNRYDKDYHDIIIDTLKKKIEPLFPDRIKLILGVVKIEFSDLSIGDCFINEKTEYIDENYSSVDYQKCNNNKLWFFDIDDVQNNRITKIFHEAIFKDILENKIEYHPFSKKQWPGFYGEELKKMFFRLCLHTYSISHIVYPVYTGIRGGKYIIYNDKKKYIKL